MARQLTLEILADSAKAERGFANVAASADKMGEKIERESKESARAINRIGDAADNSESKFMGVADVLDGMATAMGLNIGPAIDMARAAGDMTGGFAALAPTIAGFATTLKTGLGSAMTFIAAHPMLITLALLTAAFVLLWNHSETFREIVKGAFETVGNVIEGVWNWVKGNWPLLLAILTGPIGIAVHQIVTHWNTIKNGFTAVKNWIGERVGDVVGFITGIPGRIAGVASSAFDALKTGINGARNAVSERIGEIVGFVTGIPGRIGSLAGSLVQAGKDLISGLWNGISSMGGWLAGKVGDFVHRNTVGRVKDVLKIWSPSKVMEGLGKNTVQGFAEGIKDSAPIVGAAMGDVAAAPTNAVGHGGGGGTTTIVLQVDGRTLTTVVLDGLRREQARSGSLGIMAA